MIAHDLTQWPLAITIARGLTTPAEHTHCLAEWTRWLVRGERFATLRVFGDQAAMDQAQRASHDTRAWLDAHGRRIRTQLTGMAIVVPAGQLTHAARRDMERLLGVPAQAFSDIDAAIDWLEWFIAPPWSASWDRTAIRARLGPA